MEGKDNPTRPKEAGTFVSDSGDVEFRVLTREKGHHQCVGYHRPVDREPLDNWGDVGDPRRVPFPRVGG